MVIAALYPLGLPAKGIFGVNTPVCAEKAQVAEPFAATVNYAVSLPSADNDVVYTVRLASDKEDKEDKEGKEGKTEKTRTISNLCPVDYLIEWTLPREEGKSEGFLAYFDGHHYRYRDHRLQEYHFDWDSIPFLVSTGAVQTSGQFVDLLPSMLWRQVAQMQADSTFTVKIFPDTTVQGRKTVVVKAVQSVRGYDGRYFTLMAQPETLWPLKVENEYNPGQISEQLVSATYSYADPAPLRAVASEEELISRYPEVFSKYRESNYAIENIKGLPVPTFSLPSITGERYTHHRRETFAQPTLIALIDPSVATAAETVGALRQAADMAAVGTDLVLAFRSNSIDEVEALTGPARAGETLLMGAQSLARDAGASVWPTVILADPAGNVAEVLLGFNNSLASDVIQAVSLLP